MEFLPINSGNVSNQERIPKSFYLGLDRRLADRVIQYITSIDSRYPVQINDIVDDLQSLYGEYRRKKRSSFKVAVIKIYNAYLKHVDCEKNLPHNETDTAKRYKRRNGNISESSDSEFTSGDDDGLVYYEDTNQFNKSLCNLYEIPTPRSSLKTPGKVSSVEKNSCRSRLKTDKTLTTKSPKTPAGLTPNTSATNIQTSAKSVENETEIVDAKRRKLSLEPKKPAKSKATEKKFTEIVSHKSTFTFADIGGNDKCLEDVCQLLVHLKHPEVYEKLGVLPPRGLLLHGPPGCGKTLLAHAIAGELDVTFIKIAATEIISGVSGDSEQQIRDIFGKALASAPSILFIDEIDSITPKRETAQREMERRIVAQLLMCMDDLGSKESGAYVLVIGATNRPDSLDPALRRAGRFDREVSLGIPDEAARQRILKVLCRKLRLEAEFDFGAIAKNTPGYVGADLMALTRESAMVAVNRVFETLQSEEVVEMVDVSENDESASPAGRGSISRTLSWLRDQPPLNEQQLQDLYIKMEDFQCALKVVQPSSKREGFATVPDVTWEDIGALGDIREELQLSILAPVQHPDKFKSLGLNKPAGILLCGPPGCGKTLLAKAVANESGLNFISVKGPELLNMYVGESERAVRQCFQRARNSSPCVIFFDELDALCPKRSDSAEGSSSSRVVNQLLTEMDGMDERKDVFILAATNRPDIIDPAVLRPGRLDKILYVGLPTAEDRIEILKTLTKDGTKPTLEPDVSLKGLGLDLRCHGFTGADISALVREASLTALKEFIAAESLPNDAIRVSKRHFEVAFGRVRHSVSLKDQQMYETMRRTFTVRGASETTSVVNK